MRLGMYFFWTCFTAASITSTQFSDRSRVIVCKITGYMSCKTLICCYLTNCNSKFRRYSEIMGRPGNSKGTSHLQKGKILKVCRHLRFGRCFARTDRMFDLCMVTVCKITNSALKVTWGKNVNLILSQKPCKIERNGAVRAGLLYA